MGQDVRRRRQKVISFAADQEVYESLGRGMVYRELYLLLKGQPTLTAANNTAAKTGRGDEWSVVKKIEIIANNADVIWSVTGTELWWLNYFMFGQFPQVTPTLGDTSTANPSFASCLILPFWMHRSIRPMDSALDARLLSELEIKVTWGNYDDVSSDASAWTTEPTLTVFSLECSKVSGPFGTKRIKRIEKTITADQTDFQVQLPVGPMYRGFIINTTDAGVDDGDVLNNFKLVSGSTVFVDTLEEVLDGIDGFLGRSLIRTFDKAGNAYDEPKKSSSASIKGWYHYDHVTDGFMSEAIDTLGFSEITLELDVSVGSGTTKLVVIPLEYIPVRKS